MSLPKLAGTNYLRSVMKHPCATPSPAIFIETAFRAAIPVLFSLNQFSCLDIVKLRAGISWKCGRALKALISTKNDAKYYNLTKFAYELSGAALAEQALWYWFAANLVSEFVADWTSLIYQEQGCEQPPHGASQGGFFNWSIIGDGSPVEAINLFVTQKNNCGGVSGKYFDFPAGCTGNVSWTAGFGPFMGAPMCSVTQQLRQVSTGQLFGAAETWDPNSGANGIVYTHRGITGGLSGDRYVIETTGNGAPGTFALWNSGSWYMSLYGHPVDVFPQGCKPKEATWPF